MTGGHAKLAKGKGRTPFQVLGAIVDAGGEAWQFEDDLKLWRQWEKASRGRRQVAYSKGLREWAGLRKAKEDEEIASETLEAVRMTWRSRPGRGRTSSRTVPAVSAR